MEMTRRQFTVGLAAAGYLRSALFEPLSPLGVARGVVPGRVTWAHDPAAVKWDGTGSWWTDANNDQSVIDRMVFRSLRGLTNEKNDAQAWSSILRYFKRTHGRGNAGYNAGEKIAIKANPNNTTDHGEQHRQQVKRLAVEFDLQSGFAQFARVKVRFKSPKTHSSAVYASVGIAWRDWRTFAHWRTTHRFRGNIPRGSSSVFRDFSV